MNRFSKKFDSTTYNLIENERNYRHHLSKLIQISGDKKPVPTKPKQTWEHDKLLKRGQDSLRRKQTQRLLDIQKDNDRILNNLLKITQRPVQKSTLSQPKPPKPVVPPPSHNRIKSLNQTTRKNEILKILNENVKITGRLIFQESSVSKNKMTKDFQQHQQYSNRIRKVRVNSDSTFTNGGVKMSKDMRITSHGAYLPPLQGGFLSQKDPGFSYRSYSAPKLQLSALLKTDRSRQSPTRDQIKKYIGSQTHRETASDLATHGTFISQLDLRSQSIPQIESTMAERNIQGYQSERVERDAVDRENEAGLYSQRTYITSCPIEEVSPVKEEREVELVKEVSQAYEESHREDVQAETQVKQGEQELLENLSVEEKEEKVEDDVKSVQEEKKATPEVPEVEKKEEVHTEDENKEESVVDIPEDNTEGEYDDEDF